MPKGTSLIRTTRWPIAHGGYGPARRLPGRKSLVREIFLTPFAASPRWPPNWKNAPTRASPYARPSTARCKKRRGENKVNDSRPHWRKRGLKIMVLTRPAPIGAQDASCRP
jgi:hypothetical protein